ncbi:MAG: hypothetical protein WAL28_01685, partial [Nitrososphaeraceae archaeon]
WVQIPPSPLMPRFKFQMSTPPCIYQVMMEIISENKLRDLYNREKALENWTNKVNTQLKEPDRSDVLILVDHLKEQEKSALWIIRYLSAILLLRNKLPKPFSYCSKSEIKNCWSG